VDGLYLVADHQPAEAAVAHQDVGAHAEQEERNAELPCGEDARASSSAVVGS